jgi:EAL domain
LGSTLALFHTYTDGSLMQVWVTTSTDGGATWSAPVKLTTEAAHVRRVQAVVSGSTLYLFFSRNDTTGALLYQTTTDLTTWSAKQTAGQTIGASVQNTTSHFGITKLTSGTWVLGWIGASSVGESPNVSAGDLGYPVVKTATATDLSSWTAAQELTLAWSQRWPKSVAVGQEPGGTVRALAENPATQAIVRSITVLARALGLSVTAEGIETAEQLELVRRAGCERGQGYHFARPEGAEAASARLDSQRRRHHLTVVA